MSKTDDSKPLETSLSDADIIERFGGIRPMASRIGVAVTTVQGWKIRGHIPENRRQEVLRAARDQGVELNGGAGKPPPPPAARPAARPAAEPVSQAPAPASAKPPAGPEKPAAEKPRPEDLHKERAHPAPHGRAASGGTGLAWTALAVALLVGLSVLARPFWEPALYPAGIGAQPPGDSAALGQALDRIAALEARGDQPDMAAQARLDAAAAAVGRLEETAAGIERRLAAVEGSSSALSEPVRRALDATTADVESLRGDIAELRRQIDVQKQTAADALAAVTSETGALGARLADLEARPVQTGERIAALALAVGQVEAALNAGLSYRAALDRLRAIAPDDALVADGVIALVGRADGGIPGRVALQRRFAAIAPDIDRALADSGGDWLDRAWHSFTSLVTVRRTAGAADLSPVSRAEAALDDGDLVAAAAALAGAGPLGAAGDSWLDDLRARIAAEAAVASLYGRVIAPMAGAESATQ